MKNHTCLLVYSLVILLLQFGVALSPKCDAGFYYQTLPLTAQQSAILNLDNLFQGYNLSFTTQKSAQFTKMITLRNKLSLQKLQIPQDKLDGLKNCHIDKINNAWGQSFICLTEVSPKTIIHFGILTSNETAPVINVVRIVENHTNVTCFDAVLFPKQNIVLVDCVVKLQKPNRQNQLLQNVFYYHRISDGQQLNKTIKTQMYSNFKQIKKRRLEIYSDLASQHTFLLRTYYADNVDNDNKHNTYVDIFMINDPEHPWIVEILDRSYFKSKSLEIVDLKIYLSQIYILDHTKGLYRVRINTQQDIVFRGHYQGRGFNRFAIFSNNLDDTFQLVLSNNKAIIEIDWSDILQPKLLNKHMLMPESLVTQLFINSRFIIVHSLSQQNKIQYNYTWVFNRGTRNYKTAFLTIAHNMTSYIDFNEQMSYLMVIDELKLTNYAIDSGNLILKLPHDQDLLDRMMNFIIKARSVDYNSKEIQQCSFVLNFTLLENNNRTMWPIGLVPASNYIANYPGKIVIPLYQYVLGPNITYKIKQINQGQIKKSKILQAQQLNIHWQHQPPTQNVKMLKTQTFNQQPNDLLLIYIQDKDNITYISYCLPDHQELDVYCNETLTEDVGGEVSNWVTTVFFSRYSFSNHHVIAYTLTSHLNRIYLIDLTNRMNVQQVNLGRGYAGQITSIEITSKYMCVALKYVKTVLVFDLQLCLEGLCQPIYEVNHLLMYRLGIKYFNPVNIHTSIFHQDVIFIKTADSIIALDIDKQGIPVLLSSIKVVPTAQTQFTFKINLNYIIVTTQPNIIQQYDISRIYYKQVIKTKQYPMYGAKFPKSYIMDVSDYGNAVFVTANNQAGDYLVNVYRSGLPAVASLLNIIDLFTYQRIILDVTGSGIDYLTVITHEIRIFRQHQIPLAQVWTTDKNFQFYLQYSNTGSTTQLQTINVQILNLPNNISINPKLNDIMYTKNLLYSGQNRLSELNDSDWYYGNVLHMKSDCRDCENNVLVRNHIEFQQKVQMIPLIVDYEWDNDGGTIQQINNLIDLYHNGSIRNIINLPDHEICLTVSTAHKQRYKVSACVNQQGINLYLTSFVGSKSFTFEPYPSRAKQMLRLQAVNQLIILIQTTNNPFYKSQTGGILIYAINDDLSSQQAFIQLQYIGGATSPYQYPIYLVNAHLQYYPAIDEYKIYITDIKRGLYVVGFKYDSKKKQFTTIQQNYINIPEMLNNVNKKIPYDATFQAVIIASSYYDENVKSYFEQILVTTGVYHTLQINLQYNYEGQLSKCELVRQYLRYAFYTIDNYIKVHNGLFVIRQQLPHQLNNGTFNTQVLSVYDTKGAFNGTIQQRGMLGAYFVKNNEKYNFDFNFTYNQSDKHQQPRIGLTLIENFKNQITKISLHRNLSVFTKNQVDTQIIYIDLINDFNVKKIRILLNGLSPFPQWKLILIILCSIVGFFIFMGVVFVAIKIIRHKLNNGGYNQQRDSLMTENSAYT